MEIWAVANLVVGLILSKSVLLHLFITCNAIIVEVEKHYIGSRYLNMFSFGRKTQQRAFGCGRKLTALPQTKQLDYG